MVSLAIGETSCPHLRGPADEAESLRDSALWFPEIPESHLHLNETCFTGIDTPASEFRPLCYTLFGGPGGTSLQSLTRIEVLFQQSCVRAIDFHYNTGNVRRLGYRRQQLSAHDTSYLLIDGAQGEAVEMIEVDLEPCSTDLEDVASFWKYGRLRSFKVSGYYLGSSSNGSSDHTLIPCPELRSRRSQPIEDGRNIFEPSSACQSSLTR